MIKYIALWVGLSSIVIILKTPPKERCLITICNAQDECKEIQADLVNGKMNIEFEKGYMPTGARCK